MVMVGTYVPWPPIEALVSAPVDAFSESPSGKEAEPVLAMLQA
jgi:hypothetical protein